ncbi:MAG: WYL domain-containing protein, partial [Chloroflexi bacterium]|nr:WYL domain-containing protein [Chloroflexota bacterium]
MNRVDRLMAYLLMFQSRGLMRAQDFAAQFEISERTVYRDIQALSEVGVPIAAMPGEGYRLMDGYYLPPITFTPEEARALFLAVSMLDGFTVAGKTNYCRLRQAPRVFRLDRINRLRPLSKTFIPHEIDDQKPIPGKTTVVVRFDADIVRWVRERRHFSYASEQIEPNGNVIMTFRPRNTDQLISWLLSWGDSIEL